MADRYKLYYWPIPFRGHFIRYVLAHVGAEWTEVDFPEMAALKNLPLNEKPYPFLAPPVIYDMREDKWLGQLAAILMYLGRKHDLISDEDETLRIINDALDILLEITRTHGAQLWDDASWDVFISSRLPMWLSIHERWLSEATAASPYALGRTEIGLADLVLTALWHTMADRLPNMRRIVDSHAPNVMAYTDRIARTPAIHSLRTEWADRSPRYCAGQIEESLIKMLTKGTNS